MASLRRKFFSLNDENVTLHIEEDTENGFKLSFIASKWLLSSRSSVFAALFDNEGTLETLGNKVYIPDISAEAFQSFLDYLYSGQLPPKEQCNEDLLVIADKVRDISGNRFT